MLFIMKQWLLGLATEVAPIPFNIQKGGTREGVVFIEKELV